MEQAVRLGARRMTGLAPRAAPYPLLLPLLPPQQFRRIRDARRSGEGEFPANRSRDLPWPQVTSSSG